MVDRELRWELAFRTSSGPFHAEGTATLLGDTQLELRGFYILGTSGNRPLTFSLFRRGDVLEGTGHGVENIPFQATFRKR
jgi:hypothetical protein